VLDELTKGHLLDASIALPRRPFPLSFCDAGNGIATRQWNRLCECVN